MNPNQIQIFYRMMEGQVIQQYRLEHLLGAGGFGGVFQAAEVVRDRVMRKLAVKLVSNTSDEQLTELNTAVNLNHPHFIRCFAAGECQLLNADWLFLAMELAGGSLEQQLGQVAMPEPQTRKLVQEVATALQFLHRQRQVHCDLKPGNILFAEDRWKLADFGLIRQLGASTYEQTSNPIGTIAFMPPEAFDDGQGKKRVSTAWDIWSLGIMTAGVMTGKLPYHYNDQTQLLKQVVNAQVQIPQLPEPFNAIVRGCLNTNYRDRWTADQVLEALNPLPYAAQSKRPPQVSASYRQESFAAVATPQSAVVSGLRSEQYTFETVTGTDAAGLNGQRRSITVIRWIEDLGNGVLLHLVRIPAGSLMMGSPEDEVGRSSYEGPQHRVNFPEDFWIGQFEVTQAQYQAITGQNPSEFTGAQNPVEEVSWDDARNFCKNLSQRTGRAYRLPTEAEWEYACRAGTNTPFHFGQSITPDLVNYDGNYPYRNAARGNYRNKTTPVGSFPGNPWGLHDMHGNLWEWCQDEWHDSYAEKPESLKQNGSIVWETTSPSSDTLRVLRGGSWGNDARNCRSANRYWYGSSFSLNDGGFRLILAARTP